MVKGRLEAWANCCFTKALNNVDLPTFGIPTNPAEREPETEGGDDDEEEGEEKYRDEEEKEYGPGDMESAEQRIVEVEVRILHRNDKNEDEYIAAVVERIGKAGIDRSAIILKVSF